MYTRVSSLLKRLVKKTGKVAYIMMSTVGLWHTQSSGFGQQQYFPAYSLTQYLEASWVRTRHSPSAHWPEGHSTYGFGVCTFQNPYGRTNVAECDGELLGYISSLPSFEDAHGSPSGTIFAPCLRARWLQSAVGHLWVALLYMQRQERFAAQNFSSTQNIFIELLLNLMTCMALRCLFILRFRLKWMQCTEKCWYKYRNRHVKPAIVSTKRLLVVIDNINADIIKTKAVSVQSSAYFNSAIL